MTEWLLYTTKARETLYCRTTGRTGEQRKIREANRRPKLVELIFANRAYTRHSHSHTYIVYYLCIPQQKQTRLFIVLILINDIIIRAIIKRNLVASSAYIPSRKVNIDLNTAAAAIAIVGIIRSHTPHHHTFHLHSLSVAQREKKNPLLLGNREEKKARRI